MEFGDYGIWEDEEFVNPSDVVKVLNIYTDGSSINNGREGARAGIGVYFGPDDIRNVSCPVKGEQTNQNAELQALHIGVSLAAYELSANPHLSQVNIMTDSAYSINCVTVWFKSWVRNGWKTSSGGSVKHRLWIEPTALILKRRPEIKLVKVKGHSGDEGNEMADRLARAASASEKEPQPEHPEHPERPKPQSPKRVRKFVYMGPKRVDLVAREEVEDVEF
jgi:ribonuclease HI